MTTKKKKIITEEDLAKYKKLHDITFNYNRDDKDSISKKDMIFLIDSFSMFLNILVVEITSTNTTLSNQIVKNFYSLFINKKVEIKQGHNLSKYQKDKEMQFLFNRKSLHIFNLLKGHSRTDVYNQAVIGLLNLAHRYKDTEKASFHIYVKNTYHFELKRMVSILAPKHFMTMQDYNLEIFDEYDYSSKRIDNAQDVNIFEVAKIELEINRDLKIKKYEKNNPDKLVSSDRFNPLEDDFFDINWINGITSNNVFSKLNFLERKILILFFVDKMTLGQISHELGFSINMIKKNRKESIKKIKFFINKNKKQ